MIPQKLQDLIANLTAPTGLPGWCTPEKATHLAELVLSHRPVLTVELGVFGGRSFLPLALAVQEVNAETGIHGNAIGIDPWDHAAATEGMDIHDADEQKNIEYWASVPLAACRQRCADAMTAHGLWGFCALIQARSEIVAPLFIPDRIDFLHIDGNHTPLASCRDVLRWLPLCMSGAIVVFDDSNWPSTQPALALMAERCELLEDFPTFRVYRKR